MKSRLTFLPLILFSISLSARTQDREITFNDIYRKGVFSEAGPGELKSMNDGEHFTEASGSSILEYSYSTGDFIEVLFSTGQLDHPGGTGNIDAYELSLDDSLLLIATNRERIYRHSFLADYYVYDLTEHTSIPLTENGKVQLATFSPDGKYVAYVRNNDLFFFNLSDKAEMRVTFDGEFNRIINGTPDWVYEEEFSFARGFEWSPDGKYLAYYRTDESRVRMFTITRYGSLYPEAYSYKYPKAGEQNSIVSIHVYDIETGEDRVMDTGEETDQYIPRIEWTKTPGLLAISRLNRLQNRYDLILADAATGKGNVILTEENRTYIKEPDDDKVVFLEDGQHFLFSSEQDGYMHYYLYDLSGNLVLQVTRGTWDVNGFLGVDEKNQTLFYSSFEESSTRSNVYSIGLDGKGKRKISRQPGWNTAEFSKGFNYYVHVHSDAKTPSYITLHKRSGVLISVLEDNEELKQKTIEYGLPEKELFTISTNDGVALNAYVYKPKYFDETREYPLIMYVYGGPESQMVRDEWGTNPWHYLLLQKGYVVVCVDNRGTDGKGEAFRKSTYMQLGRLETEDQMEAARYLGSLDFVDASRIGIWGSSYGGYMTSLCLTRGAEIFKLGIALSPVTNWRYYDTIYTERFMRTPQENPDGYDLNSPVHYAGLMEGKFLLVHGMVDDNVHMQNSVDFTEALVSAGRQFEMMFYPDQAHGIRSAAGIHLTQKMTRFVEDNL